MSEDRDSPFETQEHSSFAMAEVPAGEAIARRVLSRLNRGPGVIPREATEDLPGRIARLAHGRLPLLDALQRRWGPSAAAWPDASELPLVTGSTRTQETGMELYAGEARPYPASSAGTLSTLPVVQARPAPDDRTTSNLMRSASDGRPVPAAAPTGVTGTAAPSPAAADSVELSPLPVVKVSRSPAQWGSPLPAESVAAGAPPASQAKPAVVPAQTMPESGAPLAPAGLQRRTSPRGDKPIDVSGPSEQSEPNATGSDGPAPFDAVTLPVEQPPPVVRAAPIAPPPAPATLLRRASETQDEPADGLPGQPETGSEAGSRAPGSALPAVNPANMPAGPSVSRAIEADTADAVVRSGASPEPADRPSPVVRPLAAPGGPASAAVSILRRAPATRNELAGVLPGRPEAGGPPEQRARATVGPATTMLSRVESGPDERPVPVEQPVGVVRSQTAPVDATLPAALSRRATEMGAEAHAGFSGSDEPHERALYPSPAPAGGAPGAAGLPPTTAIARQVGAEPGARRAGAESVTPAGQTNIAGRKPAPDVTRIWGEPIVQHVRGQRAAAPSAVADGAALTAGTIPLRQTAGADTLPLHRLPGAIETASPAASPPVVRPEKMAGHGEVAVQRASAGPGVSRRPENPPVSPSPGAGPPENDLESGSATGTVSPGTSILPVAAPLARAPLTPGHAGGRDAQSVRPPVGTVAASRQAAPGRAAAVKAAQNWQPEHLATLQVSPRIATVPGDDAGSARPSLPLPVARQASSATLASPLQQQERAALMPLQRQTESTPASAPPAGAGDSQAGAAPGGSHAATPPAPGISSPGNEGRVRLDEREMERVANSVMQLLTQRLQMEREARGM